LRAHLRCIAEATTLMPVQRRNNIGGSVLKVNCKNPSSQSGRFRSDTFIILSYQHIVELD